MTFEEWMKQQYIIAKECKCVIGGAEYIIAKAAWEAATLVEREACAEMFEDQYTDACPGTHISRSIRARSTK